MFSDQTDIALRKMAEAAAKFFEAGTNAYAAMQRAFDKDLDVLNSVKGSHDAAKLHFETAQKADVARETVETLRAEVERMHLAISNAVPLTERIEIEKLAFASKAEGWRQDAKYRAEREARRASMEGPNKKS